MNCTICTLSIYEMDASIGDGDGSGQKFAHPECYYRREASRALQSREEMQDTLTRAQAECTRLVNENRALRNILFPAPSKT
jgi:hypothetical protein